MANRIATNGRKRKSQGMLDSLPDAVNLSYSPEFHTDNIPLKVFGKAKFTADQQKANPNAPMTRVVKDVLRVGYFKTGWDAEKKPVYTQFTPELLAFIADQWAKANANGDLSNLCKTHGDIQMGGEVHPDDIIQPIERMVFDGKTLWMESYVTPEQADYLVNNHGRKVSIGLSKNYPGSNGMIYDLWTKHVAVCDRPAMGGQGKFLAMANTDYMGDPDEKGDEIDEEEIGYVPFQVVQDRFNRALILLGMQAMDEDVNAETFPAVSNELLKQKEPAGDEELTDQPEIEPVAGVETQVPNPVLMSNREPTEMADAKNDQVDATKALTEIITNLQSRLEEVFAKFTTLEQSFTAMSNLPADFSALKTEIAASRNGTSKALYVKKLTDAGEQRGLAPNLIDHYTKLGETTEWNMSNLDFIDTIPMKRGLVSPSHVDIRPTTGKKYSPEEIQKAVSLMGIPANTSK